MTAAVPEPTLEEKIAEVAHTHRWAGMLYGCLRPCSWRASADVTVEDALIEHAAHLAAVLAPLVAEVRERAVEPFERLFSGGPDTACRTTYPDGIECVEVPMFDLREAFDTARIVRASGRP
jgi:hypothetical protein